MAKAIRLTCAGATLIALVAGIFVGAGPANAVIYCKTVGIPKATGMPSRRRGPHRRLEWIARRNQMW
jgi:hypothetical protein